MPTEPDQDEAASDPATHLVRQLLDIAPRLMRLEAHRLASLPISLTHRQYRILQRVGQGATSSTAISRQANVSLAAISESVDALARRGLVSRDQDSSDRRANRLTLTSEGQMAWQAAEQALHELARDLSNHLHPRVLSCALRAVEQVERSVQAHRDEMETIRRDG